MSTFCKVILIKISIFLEITDLIKISKIEKKISNHIKIVAFLEEGAELAKVVEVDVTLAVLPLPDEETWSLNLTLEVVVVLWETADLLLLLLEPVFSLK